MAITLKAARVNANLTLDEVCKALHISKQTLISYESGKTIPKMDIGIEMARLYNMPIDNIIFLPKNCT